MNVCCLSSLIITACFETLCQCCCDCTSRQLLAGAAAYLSHTAWYARVAAASCLESLARLECSKGEPAAGQKEDSGGGGGDGASGGDALTDELAKGWVGLGDVRLDEVLARGALLLSHGENVSVLVVVQVVVVVVVAVRASCRVAHGGFCGGVDFTLHCKSNSIWLGDTRPIYILLSAARCSIWGTF